MVHADKSPSATTSRSPEQRAQEEFLLRDFEIHRRKGKGAFAAYRAGLSSAVAILDRLAAEQRKRNARAKATALTFGADAIHEFRAQLHWSGDRSVDSESDAGSLNQITSSESNSDA